MTKSLRRFLREFFTETRWEKVRGVFWFFFITMVFHISWRIWANYIHFAPVAGVIHSARIFLSTHLFTETTYVLKNILNITIFTEPQVIITKNGVRLLLGESAAGLKQMFQFIVLILFFPGSWRNKLWYIPLGIIVLHLTNIFRIMCLVILAMHWPLQIQYAHDNWLRIFYYVVIFTLWLLWVEKVGTMSFRRKKQA
jgi:exosortase/archaeosortase family protein